METTRAKARRTLEPLAKCPTGIQGLDEITFGGLPRGRPTLVCGSAGSGKTLMGMEFLVRGALEFDEPGLFVCFEEEAAELTSNAASLGFSMRGSPPCAEFEAEQKEFSVGIAQEARREEVLEMSREEMARLRKADAATNANGDPPAPNHNGGHP